MWRLFLIASIFGVATVTQASTLASLTATCPLDSTQITYQAQVSSYRSGQRLDLMPVGAIVAPAPLAVCPKDGLVVTRRSYEDKELETLRALVASEPYRSAKARGPDFQLGMIQEALGNNFAAAFSYLRASWRATGEVRTATLTESLRVYTALLSQEDVDTKQTWTNALIAGEIERQLGHFKDARARFERLQVDPRAKSRPFNMIIAFELKLIADQDSAAHVIPREMP